jgi:hypothetical protein
MKKRKYVLQIRIELLGVDPPIWRRIQVPESYSFWDMHVAIQDAMGWQDSHLHAFRFIGSEDQVGLPHDEDDGLRPGWVVQVRDLVHFGAPLALYEYDFGDSWLHEVRLEDVREAEPKGEYPRCVSGAGRCPPEDCGGPHGYSDLLRVLSDSSDPEHESMREWVGGEFDPEDFHAEQVAFRDPAQRRREVLAGAGELPN